MTLNISALNNATFDELHSSLLLSVGNGITVNGSTYVVSPNNVGLATYDNWNGVLGMPDLADVVAFHTFFPSTPTPGVVEYYQINAAGDHNPSTGGIGAEIIAENSTGYLLEQLTGYVPGANPVITPNGTFFVLSSADLSVVDGSGGATLDQLTFSTNFSTAVPEPSSMMLMPLMIGALMASRIPSVRSFLSRR